MSVLKNINPEKVFAFFEEISAIPRGSGHNDKIKEYCENFNNGSSAIRGI